MRGNSQIPTPSLTPYSPASGASPARVTLPVLGMDPGWARALAPVKGLLPSIEDFLSAEYRSGAEILPPVDSIFRAFSYPFEEVQVLIVGQDPYPTPGHAMGLSFSVAPHVDVPRSLANIYRELAEDCHVPRPTHGDLSAWAAQGVCLLNRVLTVRAGQAGSHRECGWEAITDCAIDALVARDRPLVAILWGKDAQTLTSRLGGAYILASAHPSPLSARRGFFGSRPFSQANDYLRSHGLPGVDWALPSPSMSEATAPLF